nr:hypothetical protein [Bacilli bacterium]
MSSRMDRYYENHGEETKRTNKNSTLYKDLYSNKEYDNVENLNLNVGKEININDVKDMLEKRDKYRDVKDYRIIKPEEPVMRRVRYYEEDEPNSHDINEMIGQAKVERPAEEKRRSLEETQVLTLEELVSKKSYAKKKKLNKSDMEDLVNTIYDTQMLSEDGGLFDDLKSTGKTVMAPSIRQVLEEAKEEMKDAEDMDNSFFTSSLGLKKSDFEEVEESEEGDDKTLKFITILAVIFVIVVLFILIKFALL